MAALSRKVNSIRAPYLHALSSDSSDTSTWKNFKAFQYNEIDDAMAEIISITNTGSRLQGGGFFVSNDGYVVTSAHLVLNDYTDPSQGYADIYVHVDNKNKVAGVNQFLQATIIGIDGGADVAVLKVPGITDQNFLKWGSARNLKHTETVYTVSNPLSADHNSPSVGFVRDPKYWDRISGSQDNVYVTVPTLIGNSGGPLLNYANEVVGIASYTFIQITDQILSSSNSVLIIENATTCQIRCGPAGLPPIYGSNQLVGPANNVPLIVDGHIFTAPDIVANRGVLVKNQTDPRENGIYTYTQVETVGQPWILTRFFDNSNIATIESYALTVSEGTNAGRFYAIEQKLSNVDPLYNGTVSSDNFNVSIVYISNLIAPQADLAAYSSQFQCQPIVEKIIACDRNPLLPPVLNGFKMYTNKGYLGVTLEPWDSVAQVDSLPYGPALSIPARGVWIANVNNQFGIAPIDLAFAAAFFVPPGLFTAIVNGNGIAEPIVITKINGMPIGCLDIEYPIMDILYNKVPGDTVYLTIEDVYGFYVPGPVTLSVTLGATPLLLDTPGNNVVGNIFKQGGMFMPVFTQKTEDLLKKSAKKIDEAFDMETKQPIPQTTHRTREEIAADAANFRAIANIN